MIAHSKPTRVLVQNEDIPDSEPLEKLANALLVEPQAFPGDCIV
jgi:hypothetical protein